MTVWNLVLANFLVNGLQLAILHTCTLYKGSSLGGLGTYAYYSVFNLIVTVVLLRIINRQAIKYGFLDGHRRERDTVNDRNFQSTLFSLVLPNFYRPILPLLVTFRADQLPTWRTLVWLPLNMGMYTIVLDFWHYWHHRMSHEIPGLRRLHRTHHLSIRPSALITFVYGIPDELITFVVVPLLTLETMRFVGLPLSLYEWSACALGLYWIEILGYSGLRVYATAFTPGIFTWLLHCWDAEICIEDHDLHHRIGFKKRSGNYGKQTRLWDRLFGTCLPRVECTQENIELESPVCLFSEL